MSDTLESISTSSRGLVGGVLLATMQLIIFTGSSGRNFKRGEFFVIPKMTQKVLFLCSLFFLRAEV